MLSTNPFIAKNNIYFQPEITNFKNKIEEINEDENEKNKIAKFEELSKNINSNKKVIRENTRLPQEFINKMIQFNSNQNKKKLFESYENSDIVKLMKEVGDKR